MPEEPSGSASAANVAIDKGVWEMQNVAKSFLDAYFECVYSTTSDFGSAILARIVQIVGHVHGRSQSGVSEERTACERIKRRNCRKALVQLDELVTCVTMEKHKDKCGKHNCIVIVLGLVDRSDEVVVGGTIERVVRARIVCRMLKEQRSDARDTDQERPVGTVVEPREDKARRFCGRPGVELAKYGFSKDCEGCRVAGRETRC